MLDFIPNTIKTNPPPPPMNQLEAQQGLESNLPPRPQEPDPGECCGRGCDPCIYDYYEKALLRWEKRVATIRAKESHQ